MYNYCVMHADIFYSDLYDFFKELIVLSWFHNKLMDHELKNYLSGSKTTAWEHCYWKALLRALALVVSRRKGACGNSMFTVVRTQHFHFRDLGSIPGWGTKIPQAMSCDQKKKREREREKELVSQCNSMSCSLPWENLSLKAMSAEDNT